MLEHQQVESPAAAGGAAPQVSVVIPCLDEAESVAECVRRAASALEAGGLGGEVLVVDNGSTDGSGDLAEAAGARVIREPRRGYGNAYLSGFEAALGDYIVMADADLTYDFADIPRFVAELSRGADFVIGDRMDNISPGSMPWLHRYVGNPVLTAMLNLFFASGVKDAHCGMRALRRGVLARLDLRTSGMEFASEMVIRASQEGLRVAQIPIVYHPRGGRSKLASFRDGWRHLRFLLIHSPTHLFTLPGFVVAVLGAVAAAVSLSGLQVLGREWQLHSMVGGALMMIVGTQVVALGVCARAYGMYFMGDLDPWIVRARRRMRLEHGLLLGGAVTATGAAIALAIFVIWIDRGFGQLSEEKLAVLAATLIVVGLQIFFTSFLLSILGLRRRDEPGPG